MKSLKENFYSEHQISKSLSKLEIPMVTGFVLDYMHLVCLGVTKKLIKNYINNISSSVHSKISSQLLEIRKCTPTDFQGWPRSLDEFSDFKATEFRFFLLYAGIVVMKGKVSHHEYKLLLALSVVMRILLSETMVKDNSTVSYCKNLLEWFTTESIVFYGPMFSSYNVHSIIHLADDVINHKVSLNKISAFPFENYLGKIKRKIHSGTYTLAQVVKRLDEHSKVIHLLPTKRSVIFNTNFRNRVYYISKIGFVVVEKVVENKYFCKLFKFLKLTNFFESPLPSSVIHIYHLTTLSNCKEIELEQNTLLHKAIMMPCDKGRYVLIPLLHCNLNNNFTNL